jgi:hypothetical protein
MSVPIKRLNSPDGCSGKIGAGRRRRIERLGHLWAGHSACVSYSSGPLDPAGCCGKEKGRNDLNRHPHDDGIDQGGEKSWPKAGTRSDRRIPDIKSSIRSAAET